MAGIFDRGRGKPDSVAGGEDIAAGQAEAEPPAPRSDGLPGDNKAAAPSDERAVDDGAPFQDASPAGELLRSLWGDKDGAEEEAVPAADEVEEDPGAAGRCSCGKQHANDVFDWSTYCEAFPDTSPHAAITAVFAEYALLVGRITRHLEEAVASPMTLAEGKAIASRLRSLSCVMLSQSWALCTQPRSTSCLRIYSRPCASMATL